jgi:hypothetical protein
MDFSAAFEANANEYLYNFNELSCYKNNAPIKPISYEELCKESLTIVKRAETEPIVVDAAAAVERLKELRNLNTALYAKAKAKKELLDKQTEIQSKLLVYIAEANQHAIACGGDSKEFTDTTGTYRKCLQATTTSIINTITNEIQEIEEQIKSLRELIMPLVELIKVSMDAKLTSEERETLVGGNICSVCYEKQVNRVYDGCGHTICGGCVDKINKKECHVCRTNYKKVLTLYLG